MPGCSIRTLLSALVLIPCASIGQFANPFTVSADLRDAPGGGERLRVILTVPPNHSLYENMLDVSVDPPSRIRPIELPDAERKKDPLSGEETYVYTHDVVLEYELRRHPGEPVNLTVRYQGCDATQCFFPQEQKFTLGPLAEAQNTPTHADGTTGTEEDWRIQAARFSVARRIAGYLDARDFAAFLKGTPVSARSSGESISEVFADRGVWLTVLLILLFGLALNLTPCVLPMIPVNLAIIGAGTQSLNDADTTAARAVRRARGLALGATYGAGIACVYGILGVAAVLTGARFGSLNSSPWFNAAIAVAFAALALSMFGLFNIDFTRFQGRMGAGPRSSGNLVAAFLFGGIAALLAGACVAPAVISVLLLSTDLYRKGNAAALILPFVLGIGMALPWPLAGAGFSFLPKPGKWMERVKQFFGVVIFLAAVFYAFTSYRILTAPQEPDSLAGQLALAHASGKPVLLDFWASWCKNCSKMEQTTFKDQEVRVALREFVLIKHRSEDMNAPQTRAVLDHYGVLGLPTYVVLYPTSSPHENP